MESIIDQKEDSFSCPPFDYALQSVFSCKRKSTHKTEKQFLLIKILSQKIESNFD